MNLGKKFLLRALLGIPIGIAICATISLVINMMLQGKTRMEEYQTLAFYMRSYIAAVIIGAVNGGGSAIWDIEKWGWQKKSALYFSLIFVAFMLSASYAGWITLAWADLLFSAGVFIAIYIVISVVMYYYYKRKLDRINKEIRNKRN